MRSANRPVERPGFATWRGSLLRAALGPLVLAHLALSGWYAFAEPAGRPALPATNQPSPLELFKAFVANPPPIEDVRLTYVGTPTQIRSPNGRLLGTVPGPTNFVRATWQPGWVLNLLADDLDGLSVMPFSADFNLTNKTVMVQCEDDFWSIDGRAWSVTHWRGRPQYPLDPYNPVMGHYDLDLRPLFACLNMGPHMIPPGGIRWQANRFHYTAPILENTFHITGELIPGTNGFPERMLVRYRGNTAVGHYTIRYFFGTNSDIPWFLPERILSTIQQGAKQGPNKDVRILSLRLAGNPISSNIFRPEGWLSRTPLSKFIFDGELFMMTPNGDMRLVRRRQPRPASLLSQARANRYYYMSSALAAVAFLFIAFKVERHMNTETEIEKELPCKEE